MKMLSLVTLISIFTVGCANKYDKKRVELQRQEAREMINQSNDIEIKRGLGDDKIILKDL